MRSIYVRTLLFVTTIFLLAACSKETRSLTIEAESPREDVKTEYDIFQDIKHRLHHFYFPFEADSSYLERMKLTYYARDEHIEYHYDYDTSEERKDESSNVPSYIRLFINNLEQHGIKQPQDGDFFAFDEMEGYIASPKGFLRYGGTEKTNDDTLVYEFDNVFEDEFFQAAKESDMQKQVSPSREEGYRFIENLFDIDMEDMLFLDLEQTNFEIAKVDIHRDKVVDSGNYAQVSIFYELKDSYIIELQMKHVNKDQEEASSTNWIQDGYQYELAIEYLSDEAAEMGDNAELLAEFRSFMTKKLKDA